MRKINKNINIALIFMLIGVFLCKEKAVLGALQANSALRAPMRFGMQLAVNFTDDQKAAFKKLKDDTEFDILEFLIKGFTHYKRDGYDFLFWLRRGEVLGSVQQDPIGGFHILVFDCARKRFVGSIENILIRDTKRHIIEETEFDEGVFYLQDYSMDEQSYNHYSSLLGIRAEAVREADDKRLERVKIGVGRACSLWIVPEYRNPKNVEDEYEGIFGYSGIGQTLTALDEIVAVHLYGASLRTFWGTLSNALFHKKQGAHPIYRAMSLRLFVKRFKIGDIEAINKIHITTETPIPVLSNPSVRNKL